MIPSVIDEDRTNSGEKEVFYRLRDGAGTKEWIVMHSLYLAEHARQIAGEIDFVAIIPKLGVLCLEVKGCTRLHRDNGLWYYGTDTRPDSRGPFRQSADAMHSLRSKLLKVRPALADTVFSSAVLFPYVVFNEESPEWHRWQAIDSTKFRGRPLPELLAGVMANARKYLATCKTAKWFDPASVNPTSAECQEIAQALRGDFEVMESADSARRRRESEVSRFTEEQFSALDAMQANDRIVFAGPAGTGKTVLALEAVRRCSAAGRNTLFLCFNKNLGNFLQTACERVEKNVTVRTLHGLMVELVGKENVPHDPPQNFWREKLPEMAGLRAIDSEKHAARYDSLIVDEAQDILRSEYLDFLDITLKGGLDGGNWMMFGDFDRQDIYGGQSLRTLNSRLAGSAPIYSLTENCRNTPRVAAAAHLLGGLDPDYSRVLRPDGGSKTDPIYKFYESGDEQNGLLVESLERLYHEGFRGSDIVILSPFNPPRAAVASLDEDPWKKRVRQFSLKNDGYISFSTIHAFKGLEAPAVVVTDLEKMRRADGQALLYVAVTRDLDRLVLLISQEAKKELIDFVFAGDGAGIS